MISEFLKKMTSFLNMHCINLGYTLNGELLLDAMGGEAAFSDIPADEGK